MESPDVRRLTTEQVISLVMQLPPAERQKILFALQPDREAWWKETQKKSESKLRAQAAERGLNRESMTEQERKAFVDQLLHER